MLSCPLKQITKQSAVQVKLEPSVFRLGADCPNPYLKQLQELQNNLWHMHIGYFQEP